jgi:hypothetical protein
MNENETTAPIRVFDRAYINGKFVTPHGTQVVDLVNPTNNTVIGKVTMADEIDTRQAIAAAREAFHNFSQSSKEYRMDCLQRLHDAVARRMNQLVDATVLEYGAPQERAKGSNNLAANIFLHFKEVLKDFDLARTVGTSEVVMEPAGVVGIFTPWNSSAGSIAIKVAPAIAAGCTVVIKPSEMSAMQTEVLMDAFHEAGFGIPYQHCPSRRSKSGPSVPLVLAQSTGSSASQDGGVQTSRDRYSRYPKYANPANQTAEATSHNLNSPLLTLSRIQRILHHGTTTRAKIGNHASPTRQADTSPSSTAKSPRLMPSSRLITRLR